MSGSGTRLPIPDVRTSVAIRGLSGPFAHIEPFSPCRVGPGNFTPSFSQIRSRVIPPHEGCRLPWRFGAPPVASWLAPNVGDLPPSLHGHYEAVRPQPAHR
jgi:hypothetical protein